MTTVSPAVRHRVLMAASAVLATLSLTATAYASHSWGSYHWARTSNPFTLKLGDNFSSSWDPYLVTASSDWSASSVLDTTIVAGSTRPKLCRPKSGRVEVCNASYGPNGWLGLAQIWVSGSHITQGVAKMNDTYFSSPSYNTPAWKQLVVCQEVAHTFGLDHQDENFGNPNLGSCMDYTSDPDGPPSNEHPNAHDFAQLETIYNSHTDGYSSAFMPVPPSSGGKPALEIAAAAQEWGELIRESADKGIALYEYDLGLGNRILTLVIRANLEKRATDGHD